MSGDNEDDIAVSVYEEINEEGFDVPMVDLLLDEATDGQIDLMGDVLIHLVKKDHADWAAELCRMLIHRTTADGYKPEPDYHVITNVLSYMVDMQQVEAARKVCSFILVLKDNDQGAGYFDCSDLALLLGNMVHYKHAKQAADIIYSFYCDESSEGRLYHGGIPYLLGSLVDLQHIDWVVELSKYLMLNDDDYGGSPVDFTVMGWCMAQMVTAGRADWAATICEGLRAERLPWFQLPHLLEAVAAWSDFSYVQAIGSLMEETPGPSIAHPAQPRMPYPHGIAPPPQQQWPMQAGVPPYAAPPMGFPAPSMSAHMMPFGVQQPAPMMAPSYAMPAAYGRPQWQPQQRQPQQQRQCVQQQHAQQQRGPGLANGRHPAAAPSQVERDAALLRTQNEMQELQRRIQQAEAQPRGAAGRGSTQAAEGAASLNASMQSLNLQQQQGQQQGQQQQQQQEQRASAPSNGPPPASGQSLQDAAAAQPFVPRGVHAPPFVPREGS
uniref:Uncharacterized protein n=1 Tax=Dunaliella tertiolecta TaxID=3047 RepID=A0A7S3QSD5_DUNTE